MSGAMPPRLQLVGITKRYPAVVANSDVALTVQPGEIHAVLGENGAGKSTLMKIIYGAVQPDEGSVLFDGEAVQVRNPQTGGWAWTSASHCPRSRSALRPRRLNTGWTSTPCVRCTH